MIPLFKIYQDKSDIDSVTRVIKSGMYWATGKELNEFEQKISDYIGTKYCTVLNSGTSGLVAALLASGVGDGDEVIVPSFTFIATAFSVSAVGAKPVFADIEEKSCGLDPSDIVSKINKKTKAVIAVHYAGYPCDIKNINKICKKHKILLIEDAAESFGAELDGQKIGTFSDISVFSFCQNKIISTGEGGAIATNKLSIQKKIKQIISHGRNDKGKFFEKDKPADFVRLGYNWRMSTINAALGISQINKTEKLIQKRINAAAFYMRALKNISEIEFVNGQEKSRNVFQMLPIKAKNRDYLMKYLDNSGIASRVCFLPVHKCYYYKSKQKLPVTERISKEALALPIYPGIPQKDLEFITKKIIQFYK